MTKQYDYVCKKCKEKFRTKVIAQKHINQKHFNDYFDIDYKEVKKYEKHKNWL